MNEADKMRFLYEICSLLLRVQENEKNFELVAAKFSEIPGAIGCSIWNVGGEKGIGQYRLAYYQREQSGVGNLATLDYQMANRVLSTEKDFLAHDLKGERNLSVSRQQKIKVAACCANRNNELLGALCVWYEEDPKQQLFGKDLIELVHKTALELGYSLYNYKYFSNAHSRRLNRELEIARNMQLALRPQKVPAFHDISIGIKTIPANEVGGDYADLFTTKRNNLAMAIGDVMGKGIPASLWMTVTRTMLRMAAKDDGQPHIVLNKLNEALCPDLSLQNMFITLLYAWYEPVRKTLLFANAGHLPPVLIHGKTGEHRILKTNGIYIGGKEDKKYSLSGVQLQSGDIVLFYTDGLVEAINDEHRRFGLENVIKVINRNALYPAPEISDNLCLHLGEHIGAFPQTDDISFIILKVES